jgi:hypothetical protein
MHPDLRHTNGDLFMTAIGNEIQSILDEIAADYKPLPELEDGDLTKYSLSKRISMTHRHCHNILEDKVAAGKLRRIIKKSPTGHRIVVYERSDIFEETDTA